MERLGIAGGMLFAQGYSWSVLAASGALLLCWADPDANSCLLPATRAPWWELYIPVAGPFIALRHDAVQSDFAYALAFGALGLAQSIGLSLAGVGLLWSDDGNEAAQLHVTAALDRHSQVLSTTGRF
jgi:hypothetical protein